MWDKSYWERAALPPPLQTPDTGSAAGVSPSIPAHKPAGPLPADASAAQIPAAMPDQDDQARGSGASEQSEQTHGPQLPASGLSPIIESPRPQLQPGVPSKASDAEQQAAPSRRGLPWTRAPKPGRGRAGRGGGRRPRRSRWGPIDKLRHVSSITCPCCMLGTLHGGLPPAWAASPSTDQQ